jgi:Domain of unknown function (DUF1816)
MLKSMTVFGVGLFLGLVILIQVTLKALVTAWRNRGFSFMGFEKSWGWWIELQTLHPGYVYYFGPFLSKTEAEKLKYGYSQDLESEGSKIVSINVKWCKPYQLTICTDKLLKRS